MQDDDESRFFNETKNPKINHQSDNLLIKGNDGFKYNDRFNHSTWLTFMKNRLEVARDLLRDDGVIFVQIDNKELHYVKILMDEIFKKENYKNALITRK